MSGRETPHVRAFQVGQRVRVHPDAPRPSRPGQDASVIDWQRTGKGLKYKLRFDDADWGWYSHSEIGAAL